MSNTGLTDQLSSLNPEEVSQIAFKLIELLQNFSPALQTQGLSTVFILMCDVLELNVREELVRSERIIKDSRYGHHLRFNAIRDYIEGEIKNA